MKKYTLLLLPLLALGVSACYADEKSDALDYTRLTFSESVDQDVPQDRVRATLAFKADATDATDVQNNINKAMTRFVEKVKRDKTLTVYTGSYNVNPRWNDRLKQNDGWEGQQQIYVEGEDKATVLNAAQTAQKDGFVTQNLSYYLSKEAEQSVRDSLISKALNVVEHRAALVSKQLNRPKYHVAEINVNYSDRAEPPMYARTMMMKTMGDAESFSAPVVEGKNQNVSITLNAMVLLAK